MDKLLELLQKINTSELPNSDTFILNTLKDGPEVESIQSASNLASEFLIDDKGHSIWGLHRELKDAGFPVFPGERDSFGWLTGCIQTSKGILIYG